jgi:hypothetical protein
MMPAVVNLHASKSPVQVLKPFSTSLLGWKQMLNLTAVPSHLYIDYFGLVLSELQTLSSFGSTRWLLLLTNKRI